MTTTDPDGNIKELHDKVDIKQALCKENRGKYQLAHNTLIVSHPLKQDLGLEGLTDKAKMVADGTYQPPDTTIQDTVEWFQHMEKSPKVKADKNCLQPMTLQEFQSGWKKSKEKTGSNTDGPGYSIYKSIATNNALSIVELLLLNIPFQTGYSPQHRQKALDVMLQKRPGQLDVSKLCTIGLMEADFNFLCKYIGKWAMKKAEEYEQLAKEQYRSKKKHTAIAQALNQCLTMDMALLQNTATIFCSQDAMLCFDRISYAALALGLQRKNILDTAIEAIIVTI